ncbi:MAG: hypothetical protein H0U62_11895 [Actinobacteria bacterium]|nr:hypothetical protein [Actinomycetota bacterium]
MRSGWHAELIYDLRTMSREQILLRLLIVLGAEGYAVVLTVVSRAGLVALLGIMLIGILVAALPDTGVPTLAILYLLTSWVVGAEPAWTPAALPAALALLLMHGACALAASVPAQSPLPTDVLGTQAARLGVVAGLTVAAWAAAGVVESVDVTGGLLWPMIGLAVLVAAIGGHYLLVTRRP